MAINVDDAHELSENGLAFSDDNGNVKAYITSDNGSPVGSAAPVNSWYFQQDAQLLWYKFGAGNNDWRQIRANDIAFLATTGISQNNVYDAILNHIARHNPNGPDAIATGNVQTLLPDQPNAEGSASSVARSDHVHNIPAAVAVTIGANSTNQEGTDQSFARSDHTHGIVTGNVQELNPDQGNSEGVGNALARADHVHNVPAAAAVNISTNGTNTEGNSNSFARANHTHKSEIYKEQVLQTGTASTGSASDVLIPGLTLTPPAGEYLVSFTTSVERGQNDGEAYASIYVGGSKQAASEAFFQCGKGGGGRNIAGHLTITEYPVTVNGSQAIEIRWRRAGGGGSVTSPVARHFVIKRVN